MIRHSYGYPLPHRGVTRDDGTDTVGYSRLTDGDTGSYWKSNPYLTQYFTGESDALHPQWVFMDLASPLPVTAIRIAWAEPFATQYEVQYWTGEDPIKKPPRGVWQTFPGGVVTDGKGGNATLQLATEPVSVQWLRILMTHSSDTCDPHGSADKRNCAGYAIRELYLRDDNGRRKIARFDPPHGGSGPDGDLLFFGGSVAPPRKIWTSVPGIRWDSICSLPAVSRESFRR